MPKTSSSSLRSVVRATFCIERTYPAFPAQVFKALTDPAAKAKWFTGGSGCTPQNFCFSGHLRTKTGRHRYPPRDDRAGAFLDGYDDPGSREHGSNYLLDALGKSPK